jgi:hypothetical protein
MPVATFSTFEFNVVWSALGLGRLPFPLTAPASSPVARERKAVFEQLADRGLAIGSELRTEWVALLHVLARPERSVDAVGRIVRPLAATAATRGNVAVLALQDRGSVAVGPIRAGSLVESVVALLPAEAAGPGHPVSVPVATVRRLLTELTSLADLPEADAGLLLRLAEGRVRGGQFGVNVADGGGRLRRGIPVVSWFDTAEGRYLMTNDGTMLVIAPADSARIAVRLHEVLADCPRA